MFFLTGVARYLFVPMAEAVVFAMLASYLLSRALIPTLVMYLLRGHETDSHKPASTFLGRFQKGFERLFDRFRHSYRNTLEAIMLHRPAYTAIFLACCEACGGLVLVLG